MLPSVHWFQQRYLQCVTSCLHFNWIRVNHCILWFVLLKSSPSVLRCTDATFSRSSDGIYFHDSMWPCWFWMNGVNCMAWVYRCNLSINCVNFGTLSNLVLSNLGGSIELRLESLKSRRCTIICSDHFVICVWFYLKLWYGMYTLTCLKSMSLFWGVMVSLQHTCFGKHYGCYPLLAMILGPWALLFMTLMFWFWCSTSNLVQRRHVGDAFQNGKVWTSSNVHLCADCSK